MRNSNLAALAVAALVVFTSTAMSAEPPVAPSSITDGKALFTRRCGICHLADGGGTWMLERRLGKEKSLLEARADLLVPYIRLIARHGLNGMPRFTRVELPDTDLEAIAAYLTRTGPRP